MVLFTTSKNVSNRTMFSISLSFSLMISLSIDLILFMRACLCNEKYWKCRKKWTLFSILKLHEQSGLIKPLKLWLNLWSLNWLNLDPRQVSNFNQVEWWIPYVSLHITQINSLFLKVKCNSDDSMIMPKLFHWFTLYGQNEFLKCLALTL